MIRLSGLALLLAVLCMSFPAYADYFLIYNTSCTVKGVNYITKASIPVKAYLVLRLDNTDNLLDANLIMYGKDGSRHKVYVEHDYDTASTAYKLDVSLLALGDYVVFNFSCDNSPFNFQGIAISKAVLKNVGTISTRRVAGTMTGTLMVLDEMLLDPNDAIRGTGNFTATLWPAATQYANQNGLTQNEIVVSGSGDHKGLLQTLTDKGYSSAVLP